MATDTAVGETTTKDATMDKQTYSLLMEQGASSTKFAPEVFEDLAAFARAKRLRRPDAGWRLEEAPATSKRQKVAEGKPNSRRGVNNGKTCSAKGCGKVAYCKSRCSAHYARDRRLNPDEREKAREASRRSHAKRKATAEAAK